jgi:hypothetical protein
MMQVLPKAMPTENRHRAEALLRALFMAHQELSVPLTLRELRRICEEPDKLLPLMDQLSPAGAAYKAFAGCLGKFPAWAREELRVQVLAPLGTRLMALARHDPSERGPRELLDIKGCLLDGGVVYATAGVMGKAETAECLGNMLLTDVEEAIYERMGRSGRDLSTAMVVVEAAPVYRNERLVGALPGQARGANVGLVLHVEELKHLDYPGAAYRDSLLGNTFTKVFCKPRAQDLCAVAPHLSPGEAGALCQEEEVVMRGPRIQQVKLGRLQHSD